MISASWFRSLKNELLFNDAVLKLFDSTDVGDIINLLILVNLGTKLPAVSFYYIWNVLYDRDETCFYPCSGTMKKITLAVSWVQYNPITENTIRHLFKNVISLSSRIYCLNNVVLCTIHWYFTAGTDCRPSRCVLCRLYYDIYCRGNLYFLFFDLGQRKHLLRP